MSTALVVGAGCKSAKHLMNATPAATINNRLPPLELTADAGPLSDTEGANPEDPLATYQREMRQNVVLPTDTATYGYARMIVKTATVKRTGKAFQALQMLTLLVPAVLGMPLETYETNITAEVQISDANGVVLGTYTGKGKAEAEVAVYHGFSQRDAPRLADLNALRAALAQIRPQYDTAATRLRPLLMAGGPIENSNPALRH